MTFFAGVLGFFVVLELLERTRFRPMWLPTVRDRARLAAALMFAVSGTLHFVTPQAFAAMIPPALPFPLALVYLSGALEILGAAGLLVPGTRRAATFGLLALLVAVFPANLHVALSSADTAIGPQASWYPWVRLLFQPLYIGWLLWTLPPRSARVALAEEART